MPAIKYKEITSPEQYELYCSKLEKLVFSCPKDNQAKTQICRLTLLIEKWDADHTTVGNSIPSNYFKVSQEAFSRNYKANRSGAKNDLISKLTQSLKSEVKQKEDLFESSFGAWVGNESADDIVKDIAG